MPWAGFEEMQSCPRRGGRLATNRRSGQLGAYRRFQFMQPLLKAASSTANPALVFCHQDLIDHLHCFTSDVLRDARV